MWLKNNTGKKKDNTEVYDCIWQEKTQGNTTKTKTQIWFWKANWNYDAQVLTSMYTS